ncbi:MAG: hypoxanthine phosphoribosyltransferase [Defluviitaleaceae bacterium]|nr:hypoxanthine phosphoribosyltransferase [Defluviitaleaceae bacterium]
MEIKENENEKEIKNPQIRCLISEEAIEKRIKEMAQEIEVEFEGKEIAVICLLKGAAIFMSHLIKYINSDMTIDFFDVSSYYDSTESSALGSGKIKVNRYPEGSVCGKNVLVIEDIIDTGHTLSFVHEYLKSQNPAKIKLAMLLDKPGRRIVKDICPDFVGFVIPDEFVIGYGLDFAQKYRNLPYIGVLDM